MRVPFGAGETRREGFQIGSIGSDRSLQDFSTQREPEQNVPAPSVYILFIRGAYMRQYEMCIRDRCSEMTPMYEPPTAKIRALRAQEHPDVVECRSLGYALVEALKKNCQIL